MGILEKHKLTIRLILFFVVIGSFFTITGIVLYFTIGKDEITDDRIRKVENGLINCANPNQTNIMERMAYFKVPGLSVAVVQNYEIIWAKGYGWADSSLKVNVTPDTRFQAASISKSIHSIGMMRLAQQNKLDIYADINTYLSNSDWAFPYDSISNGKNITVAQLLSHTAGLSIGGFPGYVQGMVLPTIPQILDGKPPANTAPVRSMYEPGLKYEYSGGGIMITQLILTTITNRSYTEYMQSEVLTPIGMSTSSYSQPPISDPKLLATAHDINGAEIPGKYHIYPEQAAAGLWTTPSDIARYIIDTQLSYTGKTAKVLDQQTTKLRLTLYKNNDTALGVFVDVFDGVTYFSHAGANAGFRSHYYGSVEGGNGVVVMVNSNNEYILQELINSVANVYGFVGLDKSMNCTS